MDSKDSNIKSQIQKKLYESIKQDIINLANIKNTFNNTILKNNIIIPKFFLKPEKKSNSKTNTVKTISLNLKNLKNNPPSLKNLEKIVFKRFYQHYQRDENFYNIKIINEIISNDNSHIVAEFKDFLIKDDYSEFIQKFYDTKESMDLLKQIFEYYKLSSVVYPNYILLPENKYIYKNIQKKQKIIDDQQEQEEKNNNEEEDKNVNWTDRYRPLDKTEKVFDSKVIDSILNQSNTSQIQKFVFGVSNETSIDIEENNLYDIVKNIDKAEDTCFSKFIEKNKLINNNIIKNNIINISNKENKIKENKIKEKDKQNILNSYKIKNSNKMKKFINNNINNSNTNKINSRNYKDIKELCDFGKTHTNFTSNLSNIKNINNKIKNIYSLFINKEKEKENKVLQTESHLKTRNSLNKINNKNFILVDKMQNLTNENLKNSNKVLDKGKSFGRNNKKNIFDLIINNEVHRYFKSDWNINENNNNLINNNINEIKNAILTNSKEKKDKSEKNNKKNLLHVDKIKLEPMQNLEISKKQNNENNKYIKKTVINDLLSLCSTYKDTWRTSKLSESNRELSHSINKNEIEKKIKYLNNLKKKEIDISDNIFKYMNNISRENNSTKKNKEISLDIESMNRKKNLIKHSNIKNKIKANKRKNSNTVNNLEINSNKNRNTINPIPLKNDKIHSGKLINENKFNIINSKEKEKDSTIKNKNIMSSIDNDINCVSKILIGRDSKKKKYSRNKENFGFKNLTYAMINVKKFLNNNSLPNNNTNTIPNNYTGKHYSNNNIITNEKILANSTRYKDNFKLNLDLLKKNDNTNKMCKKIETAKEILMNKNIRAFTSNDFLSKQLNNEINKKKKKESYPLSAREYNQNNNSTINSQLIKNIKYFKGVLKKDNKHNTLKNSLNEKGLNNIIFGYSNSYKNKNKYIKKIKNSKISNHNLILSNFINKKDEEKSKIETISVLSSLRKNKRKISNIIPPSINNNSEINSVLISNFNSSLNNFSLKKKSRNNINTNNLNEIKTVINVNYNEKINNKGNLIQTPNIRKKLPENIYVSNKKTSSNENYIISNKNINNKNTRYYNIEVNIHNDNKNSNNKLSKIQNNSKQHIKLNSTPFSSGSLNINFNNYTNNYCVNYTNNSILPTNHNKPKYTQIDSKVYQYKRIKNLKNNIKEHQKNKLEKLKSIKINNSNFLPLSFTDRNKKVNLFSHLNSYSINVPNKSKK